jgi:hypothetical protein
MVRQSLTDLVFWQSNISKCRGPRHVRLIVAFADIIDQSVKGYSSEMCMRLAFADIRCGRNILRTRPVGPKCLTESSSARRADVRLSRSTDACRCEFARAMAAFDR